LPADSRERLHQEALRAWIAQDFSARAAAWEQTLVAWPLDLLALRHRVRQLLKARLTTRVWDAATWQTCEGRSRRVDEAHDAAALRAALRWDIN